MKIILLHGDNTLESYDRLQTFIDIAQKRDWEIVRSDPLKSIPEQLVSDSLFQKQRLVIVEDVKLIDKKTTDWIKKHADIEVNLVICHQGILSKTFLNSLPKIEKVEEFKLPKLIWSFLDSFYPGNAKNSLLLLHKIIEKDPIEFVFSLLARQVRDLYWVKLDPKSMTYPSWRIGKLQREASKFTNHGLSDLISSLAEIDIQSKTSSENLIDLLDFLIASKLE